MSRRSATDTLADGIFAAVIVAFVLFLIALAWIGKEVATILHLRGRADQPTAPLVQRANLALIAALAVALLFAFVPALRPIATSMALFATAAWALFLVILDRSAGPHDARRLRAAGQLDAHLPPLSATHAPRANGSVPDRLRARR